MQQLREAGAPSTEGVCGSCQETWCAGHVGQIVCSLFCGAHAPIPAQCSLPCHPQQAWLMHLVAAQAGDWQVISHGAHERLQWKRAHTAIDLCRSVCIAISCWVGSTAHVHALQPACTTPEMPHMHHGLHRTHAWSQCNGICIGFVSASPAPGPSTVGLRNLMSCVEAVEESTPLL